MKYINSETLLTSKYTETILLACEKMAMFKVETTVEVYSPEDRKFWVETTIKFKVETTIKVYDAKDWKFRVETTIKFEIETTEQKLEKWIFNDFSIFFL